MSDKRLSDVLLEFFFFFFCLLLQEAELSFQQATPGKLQHRPWHCTETKP